MNYRQFQHSIVLCALALGVCFVPAGCKGSSGDNKDGNTDAVIAKAGEVTVTQRELDDYLAQLPEHVRARYETAQGRKDAANSVIDRKLLAGQAREARLDERPDLSRQIDDLLIAQLVETETNKRFTDDEAEKIYQENVDKFSSVRMHLRHILIRIRPDEGASAEQKARSRTEKLLERIRGGADFGKLARENSEDQISAANGGDLGLVSPGKLPPELAAAAEKLEPGKVSDVIQTALGFHIVKLEEAPAKTVRTMNEVRPVLKMMFKDRLRSQLVEDLRKQHPVKWVGNQEAL